MQEQMIFLGASPSYFKADDGTEYDSTKVFLAAPLVGDKAIGLAGVEYKIGKSADFDKLISGLKPMSQCMVTREIQTNGKVQRVILTDIKPVLKS